MTNVEFIHSCSLEHMLVTIIRLSKTVTNVTYNYTIVKDCITNVTYDYTIVKDCITNVTCDYALVKDCII